MAKPIDQLTVDDFEAHPLWKYSMDEDEGDETYVCPVNASAIPKKIDYEVYSVACDFTAATGARFIGFFQFVNGDFHFPDPIVVGGPEDYWCMDEPPAERDRTKFKAFFGADYPNLFPMSWTLRVPLAGRKTLMSGVYTPPA